MLTPIAELADRYSILRLKLEHDSENKEIQKEFDLYDDEICSYMDKHGLLNNAELEVLMGKLFDINGRIWDLESDIRKGKENELGLEEVGRRALAIRDLNKKRIAVKNEITEQTGEGHKEIKINHASQ